MLIPRFSIRWLLLFMLSLAFLFLMVRQAFLLQKWAVALTAGLAFVVGIFLCYAAMFLTAYGLAKLTRAIDPPQKPSNPFIVDGQYPPQEIPKHSQGSQL